MKISADRLIVFFTGAITALLPFVFVKSVVDPVKVPALATIVAVLLVFNLFHAFKGHAKAASVSFPLPYLLVWVLFLLLNAVSLAYTNNPSGNWFELARIALWIILLFSFRNIFINYPNSFQAFCRGIVVASLVEGGIGIYEIAQQYPEILRNADFTYMVMGTFAHKNLFSSGLMLFLPFCIYAIVKQQRVWRVLAFISSVLIIIEILIVQTRAVWVGIISASGTCLLLLLVIALTGKGNTQRLLAGRLKYYLMAGIVILAFSLYTIHYVQPNAYRNFNGRLQSTIDYNGPHTQSNETVRERFFLWRNTYHMWKDAPFFGWGTGSWEVTFPAYGVQHTRLEQGYVHFQRPHNDFLWRLAENGVVGLAVYLLIFIVPIYWLVRSLLSGNDDNPALSFLLLFGILAWMGDANFCFPSERNTHQLMLMALFALSMDKAARKTVFNATLVSRLSFLFLIPIALVTGLRFSGEFYSRQLYVARARNNFNEMINEGNNARSFAYQIDPVSAPIAWYQGVAEFGQQNYGMALNYFKQADHIHPNHLPTLNNLGSAYQLNGEPHKAIAAYKRALAISPDFEEAIINLSAIYLNLNELDSAILTIGRCNTNSTNPNYNGKLQAILQAEVQRLIDSGQLTPSQLGNAETLKVQLNALKHVYRRSIDNHTQFIDEFIKVL